MLLVKSEEQFYAIETTRGTKTKRTHALHIEQSRYIKDMHNYAIVRLIHHN